MKLKRRDLLKSLGLTGLGFLLGGKEALAEVLDEPGVELVEGESLEPWEWVLSAEHGCPSCSSMPPRKYQFTNEELGLPPALEASFVSVDGRRVAVTAPDRHRLVVDCVTGEHKYVRLEEWCGNDACNSVSCIGCSYNPDRVG